ncbi:hypothetical protein J6590_026786 [Homalodisca vitripennis]|nr:hypothetical protein J6590_026786 [Homalodisca vitripennis]
MVELRSSLNVCSYVRPGARFDKVVEEVGEITKVLTSSDYLLVMAGTNNVEKSGVKQLMSDVHTLINNTKHTTLLLATLPMRHDRWELDQNITKINAKLENISEVHDGTVKLLPLHLLPRHMFTAHGLHMNRRGKNRVAEMIESCHEEIQISTSTLHSGVKPTTVLIPNEIYKQVAEEVTASQQVPPVSSNSNNNRNTIETAPELSSRTTILAELETSSSTLESTLSPETNINEQPAEPQQAEKPTPESRTPTSTPTVSPGGRSYAEATATHRGHNRSQETTFSTHFKHNTLSVNSCPSPPLTTLTMSPKNIEAFDVKPSSPLNSPMSQNTLQR